MFSPWSGANDGRSVKGTSIGKCSRQLDGCVLEALDGTYGLEDPQEVQLLRMTQYLMERMDPAAIDWLRSLPMLEEVDGLRFLFLIICQIRTMVVTYS